MEGVGLIGILAKYAGLLFEQGGEGRSSGFEEGQVKKMRERMKMR